MNDTNIHLHFHAHFGCDEAVLGELNKIRKTLKGIVMEIQEMKPKFEAMGVQVAKIGEETKALIAKVAELAAAIDAANDVPQDVQDALAAVEAQLKVVDDLVADPV